MVLNKGRFNVEMTSKHIDVSLVAFIYQRADNKRVVQIKPLFSD